MICVQAKLPKRTTQRPGILAVIGRGSFGELGL